MIDNSGTYDELFDSIWNIVHNDIIFKNDTIDLYTRDNIDNYLRLINETDEYYFYMLCLPYSIQKLYKDSGKITMIDPVGGPIICVGQTIEGTDIIPYEIQSYHPDYTNMFLIISSK